MMPVEIIAQQEVVIKEESNFWELKERRARLHPESRGNASYHPISGNNCLPKLCKTQAGRSGRY